MSNLVYCEHPIKIVNPKCVEFVLRNFNDVYFQYVKDGKQCLSVFEPHLFGDYSCKALKKYILFCLRNIRKIHEEYTSLICLSTGESIDFTILVPCGHCLLCNAKKRRTLASRCSMETQSHEKLPLFVTLTYDDKHLPSFGLCYSDVQKFLKRLRINLLRKFNFKKPLRFCCAGEYGSKYQRAHYHLIIWDFPDSVGDLFAIDAFIRQIWSKGITQTKRCFDGNAGFYIGKYMTKSINLPVPEGKNPPFHHASINLGVDFVRSVALESLTFCPTDTNLQYLDRFDGKLKNLPLCSYFVKKLFPTRNEVLSSEYRNALFDAVTTFKSHEFLSCVDYLTFEALEKLYQYHGHDEFLHVFYDQDRLNESLYVLAKSRPDVPDNFLFSEANRSLIFGALIAQVSQVDLPHIANQIAHQNAIEIDEELF